MKVPFNSTYYFTCFFVSRVCPIVSRPHSSNATKILCTTAGALCVVNIDVLQSYSVFMARQVWSSGVNYTSPRRPRNTATCDLIVQSPIHFPLML